MIEIGQVLRASTEGFTCGTRSSELEYPAFGAFVITRDIAGGVDLTVVGVITAIRVDDDPLVRQLIMASDMNPAAIRDQRENRMVPIEIDVLSVGYVFQGQAVHTLPPRPPMSLDSVMLCDAEQVLYFTEQIGFLRLVLNARGVANNAELLAAVMRHAAEARPPELRYDFLVAVGREITRMLSHDPQTLQHVLLLIRPTEP